MYTSKAELIEVFGERLLIQLTDRADEPTEAIVDAVLDRAIADAGALIDGYLAARYALPLQAVPQVVGVCARDLVRYNLADPDTCSDGVKSRYKEAVATLERISKGLIRLDAAGVESPARAGEVEFVRNQGRMFDRDTLRGL